MATDSFTGTTGAQLQTYNSNWQTGNMLASDFVLDTNALKTPFSRAVTLFAFYGGSWTVDHYAEATLTQIGAADQFMGVCVRASNGNAYTFVADDAGWTLDKTVAFGVPANLASGARSQSANDVLYLSANGTTLTAKINGTTVATVTDSALTTGAPGVAGYGGAASGTAMLLDAWTGLDIVNGVGWTEGSGTVLAADEIGTVKYQRQKPTFGADGSATDVSAAAPMPLRLAPVTSGGVSAYKLVSATGTNSTAIKASPALVYGVIAGNTNSSARYVKLYNKASAPTVGTDTPAVTIPVVRTSMIPVPLGATFSTGLGIGVTSGAADSDTGGVAADEVTVTVLYK